MSPSRNDSSSARNWVKNNLVALGSVAVLAVYSAGYQRTRAAAELFAEDLSERRPVVPTPATAAPPSPERRAPVDSSNPPPTPAPKAPDPKPAAVAAPKVARANDSTRPAPAAPPKAPVPAKTPPAVAVDTAEAAKKRGPWKDGWYSGYGTSRHGDIEIGMDVKDGNIVAAYITQCLTQYSCDVIAYIVPQVVARQSADVDVISGATDNSNAFYRAVREALTKAR